MDSQELTIAGLELQLTEDGLALQVSCSPSDPRQPFDIEKLKRLLQSQNFHELFLLEPALAELSKKYETATEPFSLTIAERRNAAVKVTVARDGMSAVATVIPPFGGQKVTREQLDEALKEAGVVSGIIESSLEEIVAAGQAEEKPVAQGRPPVNGTDAIFENLIPDARDRHPAEDERGKVDLRNLGQFITVKSGAPLMRRTPATMGEAGENVQGAPIPAKSGKDSYFAPGLKGVEHAPDDDNLLVAAIAGQPVLKTHGVSVEAILTVTDVDVSTGYLDFEGSINISGDIKSGMRVSATGDVTVGGVVEAAEIHAGGDIIIKGGIVGNWSREQVHQEPSEAAQKEKTHQATSLHEAIQIRAEGSISAHFIESACVEAGNSIMVEEHVMQSELTAINQIVVGKEGTKKGHIVGGLTRATLLVQTAVIGSSSGVITAIEVGVNPTLQSKLSSFAHQLQLKSKQLEDIVHVINFAKEHPDRIKPELLEKTARTGESLQLDIEELIRERNALQAELDFAENAKVVASQKVYGGVKIHIGEKLRQIENELGPGAFVLEDNEIRYGSI